MPSSVRSPPRAGAQRRAIRRSFVTLLDDRRSQPTPGPLTGGEHRQLRGQMHLALGQRFAVDGYAEAQARQLRPQKLPGCVDERLGAAGELRLEVPPIAREDTVLRVGSRVVVLPQRVVWIGGRIRPGDRLEGPSAPGVSRQLR